MTLEVLENGVARPTALDDSKTLSLKAVDDGHFELSDGTNSEVLGKNDALSYQSGSSDGLNIRIRKEDLLQLSQGKPTTEAVIFHSTAQDGQRGLAFGPEGKDQPFTVVIGEGMVDEKTLKAKQSHINFYDINSSDAAIKGAEAPLFDLRAIDEEQQLAAARTRLNQSFNGILESTGISKNYNPSQSDLEAVTEGNPQLSSDPQSAHIVARLRMNDAITAFKNVDTDGDKQVTRKELETLAEKTPLLESLNLNRDGDLNLAEITRSLAASGITMTPDDQKMLQNLPAQLNQERNKSR